MRFSNFFDFLWEPKPIAPAHALSTDLAVVYDDQGGAAVASFANEPGSPHSCRHFPGGAGKNSLAQQIAAWRRDELGLELTPQNTFVTVPQAFTEHTRLLSLPAEVEVLDEAELLEWLLDAAVNNQPGQDERPLFDGPLESQACDFTRTQTGRVTFTEAPWEHVTETSRRLLEANSTVALLERLSTAEESHVALRVETLLRGFIRAYVHADPETLNTPEAVTAFFLATEKGLVTGLWSPALGLFQEFAEDYGAPELNAAPGEDPDFADFMPQVGNLSDLQWESERAAELRNESLLQSAKNLAFRLSASSEAGPSPHVVWCATPGVREDLMLLLGHFQNEESWALAEEPGNLHELVALGLLLGSCDSLLQRTIPVINLISSLRQRAQQREQATEAVQTVYSERRRRRAAFALVAPLIIALGVVTGSWLNGLRVGLSLSRQAQQAAAEAARLKPITEERRSFTTNFEWYKVYCQQILDLRQMQGSAIGLYADLEPRWPLAADSSFYVSELRLQANGQVEMKGYTRNEQAVTAFVRSLEFSQEQGRARFGNVAFEVKQGTPASAGAGATAPSQPGFTSSLTGNLAPGVVAWKVTARYAPLADQGDKIPGAKQSAAVPAAAPTSLKQDAGPSNQAGGQKVNNVPNQ